MYEKNTHLLPVTWKINVFVLNHFLHHMARSIQTDAPNITGICLLSVLFQLQNSLHNIWEPNCRDLLIFSHKSVSERQKTPLCYESNWNKRKKPKGPQVQVRRWMVWVSLSDAAQRFKILVDWISSLEHPHSSGLIEMLLLPSVWNITVCVYKRFSLIGAKELKPCKQKVFVLQCLITFTNPGLRCYFDITCGR